MLRVTSLLACLFLWLCPSTCKTSVAPDNGVPIHMWEQRADLQHLDVTADPPSPSNPPCGCLSAQTHGGLSGPSIHSLPAIGQISGGNIIWSHNQYENIRRNRTFYRLRLRYVRWPTKCAVLKMRVRWMSPQMEFLFRLVSQKKVKMRGSMRLHRLQTEKSMWFLRWLHFVWCKT